MSVMLVPLDFSDVTPRVVGVAARMAWATHENPLLLHVIPPDPPYVGYEPVPPSTPVDPELNLEEDRRQLEHWRTRVTGLNGQASTLEMQGPPTEQILNAARDRHARMIVMGTHGHGPFHDALLGNVTHGVLHHAPCPVVVVPAPRKKSHSPAADRPDGLPEQVATIMALVDFSDLTDPVIDQAILLARAFDSQIVVMHVVPPDPLVVDFAPPPRTEQEAEASHRELERLRHRLEQSGLRAITREATGPVSDIVIQKMEEMNPDLIVMGSHGHGALYNLFVGSVTADVLKRTTCPVVVVPRVRDGES